jgi:competence protein ComFC
MVKLSKAKEVVLDVLFPRVCMGCGKEGKYICEDCKVFLGEASLICPICNKSSFTEQKHFHCSARYGLDGLVGVWEYEGITKAALNEIKYKHIFDAISEFTENAFKVMSKDMLRFQSFLSFLHSENIHITYVPMFLKKEKRKGFNQAKLIAKIISKATEKETISLLIKTKDTSSQTNLDKEERIKNIKDSFDILPNLSFMPRNLILIDDVWITGVIMKECCKVLKRAGVQNIWGFTLFRTV